MGAPNIQQQLYLAKALNENTDEMFDHERFFKAANAEKPMNEEEIGEESISEGYTKKAMRAAGTPKFFDLENRATASELRRGGASKRTMKKYFNTDGNYSAGSRALARFNKKAGVNAGAARLSAHATKSDAKRKAARIAEESISEWLLRKIELAEGSRGKSRLERIRGTPGADNQARDRAEISRERRRAGLSPRIPDSSVQAAMLKKTKKGKTVFGVSSEPYAIDSLGNPVPKGTKPYRAAARVPKAVLKRREEAKIKEMKGKYKKANP